MRFLNSTAKPVLVLSCLLSLLFAQKLEAQAQCNCPSSPLPVPVSAAATGNSPSAAQPFALVEVPANNNIVHVALLDGTREPMNGDWVQVTLKDKEGQRTIKTRLKATNGYLEVELPLEDTNHSIQLIVSRKGYKSAAIKADSRSSCPFRAMLVPKRAVFVFDPSLPQLQQDNPEVYRLYAAGKDPFSLQGDYDYLREHEPAQLAGFMNIAVALQSSKPAPFLPFYKKIVKLQQDRFFAFADARIVDQLTREAQSGTLQRQSRLDLLLHRGSTSSYKEIGLPEANVQITLHKHVTATIDGVPCILVETDIDYFKNLWKHTFLEVIPNLALHKKTNPKTVYRFRWRSDGFTPPYQLASVNN